jgi:predicted RNA polymerase sigma factor
MVVAKRRAIDRVRRLERLEGKHQLIGYELQIRQEIAGDDLDAALDDEVGDDLLRLMFIACHPVLSAEARVALTLRLLGGLTTEEIARAFLTSESAIAQRIVRAKRTLADKHIPFEVPPEAERAARLSSVLEAIYLVFNEGYAATAGEDWMRPALCQEALRLGRVLAGLAADEPEVHGLVALMEIQTSRLAARTGPSGEPIPLLEQNRGRWDQLLIHRGFAALLRSRSRAASMGLERVDALTGEPAFKGYHLLPSVRGDLLVRLSRHDEARQEFERAAALTGNERERAVLLQRAAACASAARPSPGR